VPQYRTPRKYSVDAKHGEIRDALRECGYPVFDCSMFGRGFPDLCVGNKMGGFVLLEIKSPGEKLNENEWRFFRLFENYPRYEIQTFEDAIGILEEMLDE